MFDLETFIRRNILERGASFMDEDSVKQIANYISKYIKERGFIITPSAVNSINRSGRASIKVEDRELMIAFQRNEIRVILIDYTKKTSEVVVASWARDSVDVYSTFKERAYRISDDGFILGCIDSNTSNMTFKVYNSDSVDFAKGLLSEKNPSIDSLAETLLKDKNSILPDDIVDGHLTKDYSVVDILDEAIKKSKKEKNY